MILVNTPHHGLVHAVVGFVVEIIVHVFEAVCAHLHVRLGLVARPPPLLRRRQTAGIAAAATIPGTLRHLVCKPWHGTRHVGGRSKQCCTERRWWQKRWSPAARVVFECAPTRRFGFQYVQFHNKLAFFRSVFAAGERETRKVFAACASLPNAIDALRRACCRLVLYTSERDGLGGVVATRSPAESAW